MSAKAAAAISKDLFKHFPQPLQPPELAPPNASTESASAASASNSESNAESSTAVSAPQSMQQQSPQSQSQVHIVASTDTAVALLIDSNCTWSMYLSSKLRPLFSTNESEAWPFLTARLFFVFRTLISISISISNPIVIALQAAARSAAASGGADNCDQRHAAAHRAIGHVVVDGQRQRGR